MTAEEKIRLCNLFRIFPLKEVFNYNEFLEIVIRPHKMEEYAKYLYVYGEFYFEQTQEINSPQSQESYSKQDKIFEKWVTLCSQLKFILENENFDLFFSGKDKTGKKGGIFHDKSNINSKITELLIDDLVKYELSIDLTPNMSLYENMTNLEIIDLKLKEAEKKKFDVFGINIGRPTEASMLISHTCIQELSILLRLDKILLKESNATQIENVKMNDFNYLFIYDFLEFFKILHYEKRHELITTKKADLIERRYKTPPYQNNPQIEQLITSTIREVNAVIPYLKKRSNKRE